MTQLPFHNIVRMSGWTDDDSIHTANLGTAADGSAIAKTDEGAAVTIDTSGPNKFRLATDGDLILGILKVVELRATGPVASIGFKFIERFFLLAGDPATIGDTVVGSSGGVPNASRGGWVKKATANDATHNFIVETGTDAATGFTYVVVARL
jgi:hypothetical protein